MDSGTPNWAKVGDILLLARVTQASHRFGGASMIQEALQVSGRFTMTGRTNTRLRTRQPDVPTGYPQTTGSAAAILRRR